MDNLIDQIKTLKKSNKLVIVEGKKDINALAKLGVYKVIEINGPLELFAEKVSKRVNEVVLLTDLDLEGKKLYKRLNHLLSQLGVKVDNNFRNYLFKHTQLTQIEGVDTYFKKN